MAKRLSEACPSRGYARPVIWLAAFALLAVLAAGARADVAGGTAAFKDGNWGVALAELKAPAAAGDAAAQYWMGRLYEKGLGVAKSDQQAFDWLVRAAEQGHADAARIVGAFYQTCPYQKSHPDYGP